MSPAKRKVAVRGKRGGKGRARGAVRTTRVKVRPVTCDLPVRHLAAAFDRPADAAELLAHVPGCGACTTSLAVLAAAGAGLKHLTAEAAGTAVERVLVRGKEEGRRKLADLVYELVKACLVVVQDINRRLHLDQRPRDQLVINGEMRGVAARLPRGARSAVDKLPRGRPSEDLALAAAESCIKILQDVEGSTQRQRLSRSVFLICSGQPEEAEKLLVDGLDSGTFGACLPHVYNNLLWALNRQRKYEAALALGDRVKVDRSSEWLFALNLAVASAISGKRGLFGAHAKRLKSLHQKADGAEYERQEQHLLFEVPRFAEKLGVRPAVMATALGISTRLPAVSTDATA